MEILIRSDHLVDLCYRDLLIADALCLQDNVASFDRGRDGPASDRLGHPGSIFHQAQIGGLNEGWNLPTGQTFL